MRDAGREIDPADLPPELEWESPVWWLYEMVQTQWRVGFSGRMGLDYGPAMGIINEQRWSVSFALGLLRVIEIELMKADKEDVGQPGQD